MIGRSNPDYLLWSLPLWIIAILLVIYVLFLRDDGGSNGPAVVLTSTQVAPVATATPEATETVVAPTATPTVAAPTATPAPRTYTVQAGDNLTAICASELPDLPDCVQAVVTLNGLAGADQIAVGQELQLPSPPSSAPGIATATPSP